MALILHIFRGISLMLTHKLEIQTLFIVYYNTSTEQTMFISLQINTEEVQMNKEIR